MIIYRLVLLVVLIVTWQYASGRLVPEFFISKPSAILAALRDFVLTGNLFFHVGITATEAFTGFVLGATAGIVAGVALGRIHFLADLLQPFILAFYSLPKIALAPLFVLWIGIGIEMKIVLTGTVVFFLVFLNTFTGVRGVSRELIAILHLMGANERQVLRQDRPALRDHLGFRGPADLGALCPDRRHCRRADRLQSWPGLPAGQCVRPVRHRRRLRRAGRDHGAGLRPERPGPPCRNQAHALEDQGVPTRDVDLIPAGPGPHRHPGE
jgi:hypothetical protein